MTIAQFLGHRVHAMAGRYAHLTAEQRKRAIEKLPNMTKPKQLVKKPGKATSEDRGAKKAM